MMLWKLSKRLPSAATGKILYTTAVLPRMHATIYPVRFWPLPLPRIMECGRAKSTRPTYWTKVRNPSHPDKYALHVTPSQRTNAAALQFWSQASLNHGAATQAGTAPLSLRVCNSQLYLDVPVEEAHHRALDCYLGHANDCLLYTSDAADE